MRTREEILKHFIVFTDDEKDIQTGQLENVVKAMKAYAREACEEQKRICAQELKDQFSFVSPLRVDVILRSKLPEGLE